MIREAGPAAWAFALLSVRFGELKVTEDRGGRVGLRRSGGDVARGSRSGLVDWGQVVSLEESIATKGLWNLRTPM